MQVRLRYFYVDFGHAYCSSRLSKVGSTSWSSTYTFCFLHLWLTSVHVHGSPLLPREGHVEVCVSKFSGIPSLFYIIFHSAAFWVSQLPRNFQSSTHSTTTTSKYLSQELTFLQYLHSPQYYSLLHEKQRATPSPSKPQSRSTLVFVKIHYQAQYFSFIMAPHSNHSTTSSVDAQNGSAATSQSMYQTDPPSYSTPAITHVTLADLARYPAGSSQSNDTSNYAPVNRNYSGISHENGSYSSRSQSQVATTYATSYYSVESDYANQPYPSETYYPPPTTSYGGEGTGTYASALSIEEYEEQSGDPNEDVAESEDSYATDSGHPQNGYTTPQQYSSPSMRRWSRDNAPEERIRMGLPRWESEQHRLDYQRDRNTEESRRRREQRRRENQNRRSHNH